MDESQEKILEIKERVTCEGLRINRLPKKTKEEFLKLANEEFASDYGLTLKYNLEQCQEYQNVKKIMFSDIFVGKFGIKKELKEEVIKTDDIKKG